MFAVLRDDYRHKGAAQASDGIRIACEERAHTPIVFGDFQPMRSWKLLLAAKTHAHPTQPTHVCVADSLRTNEFSNVKIPSDITGWLVT